MSYVTSADIREFIKNYLGQKLETNGRARLEHLPEDCDLLVSGVLDDSIGFLDLLLAIEEFAGREIDFEILDPEEMSIVGPLSRFVSEQMSGIKLERHES
jgi:acyl carrier protein